MASTRKFMFDTDFDEHFSRPRTAPMIEPKPEPEPEPEPEPPPEPTFSVAELEAARTEAFAAGEQAGLAEGEVTTERRLATALELIGDGLTQLRAQVDQQQLAAEESAVRVAIAIARKLLPETARRNGLIEIEAMVRQCLVELLEERRLVVWVAEAQRSVLAERLAAVTEAGGFTGKLVVLVDPALEIGDCRIEWAEGGAERDSQRLWQDIDRIATRLLSAPQHGPEGAEDHSDAPAADAAAANDGGTA